MVDHRRAMRVRLGCLRILFPPKHRSACAEQQAEQNRQDFCRRLHNDFTGAAKRRRY